MCNPAAAIAVATLVMTAYTTSEQSKSQKAVAHYNAREKENESTRNRNKGVEEELRHRRTVAELQSKQRAELGAANVDINSGSALALQEDAKLMGEVDALRIRSNFAQGSSSLDRSAGLDYMQGEAAETAGQAAVAGSLLTAAGGAVNSQWYTADSSAMNTTTTGAQANAKVGNIG